MRSHAPVAWHAKARRALCMQRMTEDCGRIRAKEADGYELSGGQAAALLNAEKGIDKLREEIAELEDALQVLSLFEFVCGLVLWGCDKPCEDSAELADALQACLMHFRFGRSL